MAETKTEGEHPPLTDAWLDLLDGCTQITERDKERLVAEVKRLRAILDGDPHQTATPEQRRAWRASAVRYADKLEAKIKRLKPRVDLFWKIIGDGPHHDTNLLLLVKDLRSAMLCGAEGKVHCYTLGGFLCDHIDKEQAVDVDDQGKATRNIEKGEVIEMSLDTYAKIKKEQVMKKKPTIAELKAILDRKIDVPIEILPNGEIRERPMDHHIECIQCRTTHRLSMYAHRHNPDSPIVGWVFCCDDCREDVRHREIHIGAVDPPADPLSLTKDDTIRVLHEERNEARLECERLRERYNNEKQDRISAEVNGEKFAGAYKTAEAECERLRGELEDAQGRH